MIVSCPRCGTRYRIDNAQLGDGGRDVRCGHCGNNWFVVPDPDAPEGVGGHGVSAKGPSLPPLPPSAPRRFADGLELRQRTRAVVSWLLLVVLVLSVAGIILGRNEIATALPEAAQIYQKIGLPLTFETKLEFRRLVSEQVTEGEGLALVVRGEIQNVTGEPTLLPLLRLELLTEDQVVLASREFDLAMDRLDAGMSQPFEIRFDDPPEPARSFRLTFPSAAAAAN